jgi:hypothetical protein
MSWTLRNADQNYQKSFEICSWRGMEKISLTDRVKNEEVLQTVKQEKTILPKIKRMKANCTGHILRRNCLLKHVIEEKIEGGTQVTGRRRRRNQLLEVINNTTGYWKLQR